MSEAFQKGGDDSQGARGSRRWCTSRGNYGAQDRPSLRWNWRAPWGTIIEHAELQNLQRRLPRSILRGAAALPGRPIRLRVVRKFDRPVHT
jgi:hypothetical protein